MRIGLIGVGWIGAFHASTLRGLPEVDSLIVTDVDLTRTRDVAGQAGAQAAGSVDELLDAGLDGLVIAAATATLVALPPRNFPNVSTSSSPTPACSGYRSTPTRPMVSTS